MKGENVAYVFGSTLFKAYLCYPVKDIFKNGLGSVFCMDNTLIYYFV